MQSNDKKKIYHHSLSLKQIYGYTVGRNYKNTASEIIHFHLENILKISQGNTMNNYFINPYSVLFFSYKLNYIPSDYA